MDVFIVSLVLSKLQPRALGRVFSDYHERILRVDRCRLVFEPVVGVLDVVGSLSGVGVQSELFG